MIEVSWQPGRSPHPPQILIGFDATALTLYQRIRGDLKDDTLVLLGQTFLAVKADFSSLPWVDSVGYLSACRANSTLYIPSHLQPNVPTQWLEDYFGPTHHDILYWPQTHRVIHAHQYWSAAVVKQDKLLDIWYEHCSEALTALGH